jgi:hypothetical protein
MPGCEDVDDLKRICYQCVEEDFLRAEIKELGQRRQCSYCKHRAKSYTIRDIAERIEEAFEQHFTRTSDQPSSWQQHLLSDKESTYEWQREGEPVVYAIMNAAEVPHQAAEDIQAVLDDKHGDFESAAIGEETEFCHDSYYEEKGADDWAWQEEWDSFERSLKTETRFFSRSGARHLASIFHDIDKMSTADGRPLVVDAGPATSLESVYRARVLQSDDKLKTALCRPDLHLGSPPAQLATAGRMNAKGISVFYGASEPRVAVAEVRPPVGSQVAVARFNIVRSLRLLDLTAVSEVSEPGSIFDSRYAGRLERASFLRSLSQRITRPIMPDDEAFEYLVTQAIADFLATENDPPLDGILFPSVQAAGMNVVLFHKAARVKALDVPEGTEITASTGHRTDEGWETDYSVIAETSPPKTRETKKVKDDGRFPDAFMAVPKPFDSCEVRKEALRVDLDSVEVHIVRRVEFETEDHCVRRHRWEKNIRELKLGPRLPKT